MNHVTIGVYASDNHKVNIVKPEHLEEHIQYNLTLRPGRAFFVDGKCLNHGYLSDEKVEEWEMKIGQMKFDTSRSSEPYH